MEPGAIIGAIGKTFGALLGFFGQKLCVYIEVTANAEKPFRLMILNHSRFVVFLDRLEVSPDGFPEVESGWQLGRSSLFTEKDLMPTQRLMLLMSHKELGDVPIRKFTAHYRTKLFGINVPRKEQSYEHIFEKSVHGLNLVISIPTG